MGTDRRRRRERNDCSGCASSRNHFRRVGHALGSRVERGGSGRTKPGTANTGSGTNRLDATAGIFKGRSSRSLLREPIPFQNNGRCTHMDPDQPDLTRPEPGIPRNLDAVSAKDVDRNGTRGVIYTIAPSPLRAPLLWIGTDDGLIQLTQDDGKTWADVTPRELTPWSKVAMIEASHVDPNVAYAAVDRHRLTANDPRTEGRRG